MAATLDGLVKETGAVFEAKFMLPWSFSEEAAAEKHMAQLQHNMLVANTGKSVLSIINGGGKWVEISIEADPIYQTVLIAAEKAFWRSVKSGEPPVLFDCEPPKPRIEAVRVVDMGGSNSWTEFASLFLRTRDAHLDHERAKTELKVLMPEDAKEARGHVGWDSRSATNSRYLCAEHITGITIILGTRWRGGKDGLLIRSQQRECSELRRGLSNEYDVSEDMCQGEEISFIAVLVGQSLVLRGRSSLPLPTTDQVGGS
jgi:hypothetical protein